MSIRNEKANYDVIIVGGGLAGLCAALAAAREGIKTAIVQNRPVFGGTGSSEIRMHIVGANCHSSKPNLRETGIIEEILLENKSRNPYAVFPIFDMIMWEKAYLEKNLTVYLNTNCDEVITDNSTIKEIVCHQSTTETEWHFSAKIFVDATGNGTVGVMAGALSRIGSEAKSEFNEPTAPECANNYTMGNTLLFLAKDRGEPVTFVKPVWANTYSEEDLKLRPHVDLVCAQVSGGGMTAPDSNENRLPEFSNVDAGYWWIELGGDYDDIIGQGEEIRDDLLKVVYGVWDHIKNRGDHGVENYDLEWVGMIPGMRESRRLEGDYILNENDIRSNRIFEDAVAYGGWPMDQHNPKGVNDLEGFGSRVFNFEGCYTIPYRCYYSKNIDNLMMAGRDISCSKMAFSSSRVMGTCSVGGQAVGTAAAVAIKHGCLPREVGQRYIKELQQLLLKNDCYIPGFSNEDINDLAKKATIYASSETLNGPAANVINGVSRSVGNNTNYWESEELGNGQSITLQLPGEAKIKELRLTFDTDLSHEIQPSLIENVRKRQVKGMPLELVKTYSVILKNDGKEVYHINISDNHERQNIIILPELLCDEITVLVTETHGINCARIFEIRAYC